MAGDAVGVVYHTAPVDELAVVGGIANGSFRRSGSAIGTCC